MPYIEVTKTASPTAVPETGGDVLFTFVVKNTSSEEPVTITSLTDSVYGTLDGDDDCKVGTVLAAGASCEFSFTKWVEGDFSGPDHVNVFTAKAVDNDNTEATDDDDATVDFTNVMPYIMVEKTANPTAVPETGGSVTFTFVVKNTSTEEPVTITSLEDSVYGTLLGDADCKVGTILTADASCEFTLTQWVEGDFSGPDHINVFTAKAVDNDNTEATHSDDATVDFTDVAPAIEVTKTADPTAVLETGGNVVFTFVVTNTSTEEAVTITSLTDSVYGTLPGDADCKVGTVLVASASCNFTLTKWVEGDFSGPDHVNTFTAVAKDNDNTPATDSDDATVDFTNVLPYIEVTKTASQKQVFDPGENVTFTFKVKNTSTEEPVTITSLSDSVYGTLLGDADCKVNTVLAAGASCEFTITRLVASDHTNVFTAKAVDNDNTEATDDDDASVEMINPHLTITKVTVDGMTEGDALNILITEPISWKYTVKNDGDVTLTNVAVTDSQSVNIDCDGGTNTTSDHVITSLAVDASVTCTATGTAAKGNYNNTGTASTAYTDTDSDNAPRSASDSSSYFGADPQIDIVKKTVGSDGSEGDNVFILINGAVTWKYYVTNTGNVALSNVTVTDNKGVNIDCDGGTNTAIDHVIASLGIGASVTCTATGTNTTPIGTWYNNTGTATADPYTDSAGHNRTATDSDNSGYYSQNPGLVTNSQLCDFGSTFTLVFTPDVKNYTSTLQAYKLSDSNPGQFFYNVFKTGGNGTVTLTLPYPFITQGATPIHVYSSLTAYTSNGQTCLQPTGEIKNYQTQVTLGSYGTSPSYPGSTHTVTLSGLPTTGFMYINIHLDYGLEKLNGWVKDKNNALYNLTINPTMPKVNILNNTTHTFTSSIQNSTDAIANTNEFKRVKGFGGLVMYKVGAVNGVPVYEPVVGAQIKLYSPTGQYIETMTADVNGWYLSTFVPGGKSATYTLVLVADSGKVLGVAKVYASQTKSVTVGGSLKFGEGNFTIVP